MRRQALMLRRFGLWLLLGTAALVCSAQISTLSGALAVDPASPGYGRSFTLTATYTYASGPAPTGSVSFFVDGATVGSGSLASGIASVTVSAPTYAVGSHTLTAQYAGDANYAPLTLTGVLTVTALPTETYMTDVVTPIHYGEIIGDIARGYADSTSPMAGDRQLLDGGSLEFLIDGTVVCTLPYLTGVSQVCPATTGAGYAAGTYTLSSAYTGNLYYAPSASPGYTVLVLADDTTGTLTSSVNPSTVGQAVTFTATFSSPFATPNGTVTFYDGSAALGTGTLNAAGAATLTTAALALGSHNLTAQYAGNGNFNPAATAVLVQVVQSAPVATTMTLASSTNPSSVGQNVTFTAVVTGGTTTVSQPSGTISFTIDGAAVGSGVLTGGAASFSIATLAQGNHAVVATFAGGTTAQGDAFAGSSASLTQVVQAAPPAPAFTMSVTPAALSVPIGNDAIATVTLTALNGFNQNVGVSCGDLPREVTCTFSADSLASGNGVILLRVHATAPHDCDNSQEYFHAAGAVTWLGGALLAGLAMLLRRRRHAVVLALLLAVSVMLSGCGHCTDLGVRPGNYSFTVTATTGILPVAIKVGQTQVNETLTQTIRMVARL